VAVHFLATESPFCLMTRLAADSILALTKKTKLSREELTAVLTAALKATGVRAAAIYHMLTELKDYHRAIAKTVKSTTFLERLFISIIDQDSDFADLIASHFLLVLRDVKRIGLQDFNDIRFSTITWSTETSIIRPMLPYRHAFQHHADCNDRDT
jgi:hypothetical protein